MEKTENMLAVASSIRASHVELDCPNCGALIEGWNRDPRGLEDACDKCKKPYRIARDADVTIR